MLLAEGVEMVVSVPMETGVGPLETVAMVATVALALLGLEETAGWEEMDSMSRE